jgi:hypothetical protein
LLKILSLGSNPSAVQGDFEKLYAGITQVTFNEDNRNHIEKIHMQFKGTSEDDEIFDLVVAEGAIELWLQQLTEEMIRTIRQECKNGCAEAGTIPLREFVYNQCS